jgi:tight adherence protein B
MSGSMLALMAIFFFVAIGGAAFVFTDGKSGRTQKRMVSMTRPTAVGAAARLAADQTQQRRKNVTALLKDLEKQQAEKKKKPTLRRRLEQAGTEMEPRSYYIASAIVGLAIAGVCLLTKQPIWVTPLAAFAGFAGLPNWTLSFLKARRQKAFTSEFANAIDVIVRSVKSGLPTNEALKIVATELPQPVAGEFERLVEGLKVGVSLDQGCRRMYESMPTPEVNFFGIVMTIQAKSGGNLSEALSNLANVLRDRKRLEGKVRAMSSEAKASAMIIGSLPPGVALLVYLSTPTYIEALFTSRMGNVMLMGCGVWMTIGILVMKKMIAFKH